MAALDNIYTATPVVRGEREGQFFGGDRVAVAKAKARETLMEARYCLRCSAPCAASRPPGEDARVLRRTLGEGLCANCAITDFLRRMSPLDVVLDRQGPEVLLLPSIQAQVGRVLAAGNSDASLTEIDWPTVVANWSLPVKGGTLC